MNQSDRLKALLATLGVANWADFCHDPPEWQPDFSSIFQSDTGRSRLGGAADHAGGPAAGPGRVDDGIGGCDFGGCV